ncbi:MAG: hypothetical protein RL559_523 [Pseudomonadota bacterium]|jgi:Tfp pilus assembly protein PilX
MNPQAHPQSGAVQLLLVLTLVGLAALASAMVTRSVLSDMLGQRAAALSQQARLAAQAALATAEAELLSRYASQSDPLADLPSRSCPSEQAAPRWQCSTLPLSWPSLGQAPSRWTLQAWLSRDLLQAPHVVQLRASAQWPETGARTTQQVSLWVPSLAPAPSTPTSTTVVLGESLLNPLTTPCARTAWRQVLGDISPAQLQAWSHAQARNGLSADSQPPRSIWWVDSPADWQQPLGDASHPVLLVFSAQACALRCPSIASAARIHGTVYLDAGCSDDKVRGWQSGPIVGQLVVEAGLPDLAASPQISAQPSVRQAYALVWPAGIDAQRLQAVPGSRWEGP